MAGPQRNVTDDGKNLSALVNGNRASIIQPNFHPPGAFLLHKAADVRIGLQDDGLADGIDLFEIRQRVGGHIRADKGYIFLQSAVLLSRIFVTQKLPHMREPLRYNQI